MDTPNQNNTNLQSIDSLVGATNKLVGDYANTPVPAPDIPSLGYNMPSGTDITAKYQEFLKAVQNDPGIVTYYQQLLDFSKGDTQTAIKQLQQDYQTGVRQTTDTLKNSLAQLGTTFTQESQGLLDTLNKRGIALTQNGNSGPMTYAGAGEAKNELDTLNSSQTLRQEATQRSAMQNVENSGIKLQQGTQNANTALRNQAITLQQQKQQDITNRANVGYQSWQQDQALQAQKAVQQQNQRANDPGYSDWKSSSASSITNPGHQAWLDQGAKAGYQ